MKSNGKPTNGYKAIIFDFGGTLDANGVAWMDRLFPIYREEGVGLSAEEFANLFLQVDESLTGQKKLRGQGYRETILAQTREVLRLAGARRLGLAERIADRFAEESQKSFDKTQKVLTRLHRSYRLGIISNFYGNLDAVFKSINMDPFFEVLADSQRLGVSKPDPRIFQYALREMELKPEQCLMVGDSLSADMGGARAIGMPHAWLYGDRFKQGKPSEACCKGDRVLRSLDELTELLS